MSTRGIDTGTGRPEDYISRVETNPGLKGNDAGPKMPDLRNVRSEPPPQTKPRRGSFLDTVKEALKPGDIRAGKASQGAWEGQLMESTSSMTTGSHNQQKTTGWHTASSGTQHQHHNHQEDGTKLFDAPLSVPEHHHARARHRSHGVMDHLLGRSRAHDDPSGIIGSRRDRAALGGGSGTNTAKKSTGPPGGLNEDDDGSYTFDVPRGSREDPRRSAVDAVPRASALDMDEGVNHAYSTRHHAKKTSKDTGGTQQSKNAASSSQYLTDSGLYE
ncbi:hypothetical protein PG991_015222 [Apiospora marii]|uniref:Uncharacterized protein n=1 Tax=Apiospora marii TaxID=335849 RepID=A0ABR1R133_9PEZI